MNKSNNTEVVPGSSEVCTSGKYTSGRLLTSCTQRNSQDELDQRDIVTRHDCLKLVRELNREVTAYRSLLLGLGSVCDCEQLREDLKKTRRRGQLLIKEVKTKLVPWITSNSDVGHHPDWTRIWTIFICCMDVLQAEMTKTLTLQQTFCLYSDSCSLINSGWNGNDCCNKMMADNLSLDVFLEKMYTEREETMHLERELTDLQQVVEELRNISKLRFPISETTDSISLSGNNNRISSDMEKGYYQPENRNKVHETSNKRWNCICWTVVILTTISFLATVLGVCVAFLS